MARRPVFLPPASYRQRRVRDAAHLLPVVGVVLLLVPLLWTPSDAEGGIGNAAALLYVFGVWAGITFAAWLLSRALRPVSDATDEGERDDLP